MTTLGPLSSALKKSATAAAWASTLAAGAGSDSPCPGKSSATMRSAPPSSDKLLLDVRNLRTHFKVLDGIVPAVDGVSFSLERGKSIGIVGDEMLSNSRVVAVVNAALALKRERQRDARLVGDAVALVGS